MSKNKKKVKLTANELKKDEFVVEENNKKAILLILAAILVVVALIVTGIYYSSVNDKKEVKKKEKEKVVEPVEKEEIKEVEKEVIVVYTDTIVPTLSVEGNTYQTLKVNATISASDNDGLKTIEYGWTNDSIYAPATMTTVNVEGKSFNLNVSYNPNTNSYSKVYLWARVSDAYGNISTYKVKEFITAYGVDTTIQNGTPAVVNEITGDLVVNTAGTELSNIKINGDLYITSNVGTGDVTLDNVVVTGTTFVNGGGSNSVHFDKSVFNIIVLNSETNVRLDLVNTSIQKTNLYTNAIIDKDDLSTVAEAVVYNPITLKVKGNFGKLTALAGVDLYETEENTSFQNIDVKTGEEVILLTDVTTLNLINETSKVIVDKDVIVNNANVSGNNSSVTGNGTLELLNVTATNANIDTFVSKQINDETENIIVNPLSKLDLLYDSDINRVSVEFAINRNILTDTPVKDEEGTEYLISPEYTIEEAQAEAEENFEDLMDKIKEGVTTGTELDQLLTLNGDYDIIATFYYFKENIDGSLEKVYLNNTQSKFTNGFDKKSDGSELETEGTLDTEITYEASDPTQEPALDNTYVYDSSLSEISATELETIIEEAKEQKLYVDLIVIEEDQIYLKTEEVVIDEVTYD